MPEKACLTLAPETGIVDKGFVHEVTYQLIFKEIGNAQNEDQGKTIKTHTKFSLDYTCDGRTGTYISDSSSCCVTAEKYKSSNDSYSTGGSRCCNTTGTCISGNYGKLSEVDCNISAVSSQDVRYGDMPTQISCTCK